MVVDGDWPSSRILNASRVSLHSKLIQPGSQGGSDSSLASCRRDLLKNIWPLRLCHALPTDFVETMLALEDVPIGSAIACLTVPCEKIVV
jgi:hypothetical protein